MYLSRKALDKLARAHRLSITSNTEQEIIDIVLDQEIVSYCTEKGCVSFDINDIVTEQKVY